MDIPPPGVEMSQLAKKNWGEKRNGWVAGHLAMFDTYHLTRKNASYRFVIWHGHPWGGTISDVRDRGTPGYRREWQVAFRPRRIDMV
jgi:hypothetical protein